MNINLPKGKEKRPPVECRFTYDTSGLLEVDVTVLETGLTKQLIIHDDSEEMSSADLAERREMLEGLKIHPRKDVINAAMIARAERCYESFLGETREFIGQLMVNFDRVLGSQDPRQIKDARKYLGEQLDAIEGQTFL